MVRLDWRGITIRQGLHGQCQPDLAENGRMYPVREVSEFVENIAEFGPDPAYHGARGAVVDVGLLVWQA